jgi:NhaA family Na+:H+ antiporter
MSQNVSRLGTRTGRRRLASQLIRSFSEFFRLEASGGLVLLGCAVAAILIANSNWADAYFGLWKVQGHIGLGGFTIEESLLHWINDGLMAVFFLVVGLEIKRELLVGELSSLRLAGLPIAAAMGGMIVPALLYAALNAGTPGARGWGIPMATDIAFSLGILALLGTRVPLGLKVFLAALAIVDDLGAVLVIALFYTNDLDLAMLARAGVVLLALVALNKAGERRMLPYVVLGIALWVLFLKSGVHATIAGVLLALTIPARVRIDPESFADQGQQLLKELKSSSAEGGRVLLSESAQDAVHALSQSCRDVQMPLERLKHALHPWVTFAIVPLFGFANAGVAVKGDLGSQLSNPVTLGIIMGLARRALQPGVSSRRRQLEEDLGGWVPGRHWLYDVAVHRRPGIQ